MLHLDMLPLPAIGVPNFLLQYTPFDADYVAQTLDCQGCGALQGMDELCQIQWAYELVQRMIQQVG